MADLHEVPFSAALYFERWRGEDEEYEEEEERIKEVPDPKLKGLTFRERWEVIGSPLPEAFVREDPPLSPLDGLHESGVFSGMTASMKMRNCELVQNRGTSVASTPKSASAYRRETRAAKESGCPLRLLMNKSLSTGSVLAPVEYIRPDNPALVRERLLSLRNSSKMQKSSACGSRSQPQLESPRTKPETPANSSLTASPPPRNVVLSEFRHAPTARRTSIVDTPEKTTRKREEMDDVEAAFAGYKTTALEKGVERVLEQLRRTDPALGELLDFFMQHFGSLKLAFKQLDINANGALSMQEFADGLRMLRSRRGAGPIEAHMATLFNRLDYDSRGSIALEDVVYELENNLDPFLIRLREFCDEVGKKAGTMTSTSNQDENVKMRHYGGIFRVGHRDSQMSKEHFCAALTHMRYPQWHAEELFHRLDKDDSGHLSLSEFTVFMSPDPPARRRDRKGPLVPIGSDTREKQAFTALSRSQSPASSKRNQGDCGSGQNQRPDWLALVEHGLSKDGRRNRKHTELSRNGMHVMRGDRECLRDLAPIGCAIIDFNENRERCRISAF